MLSYVNLNRILNFIQEGAAESKGCRHALAHFMPHDSNCEFSNEVFTYEHIPQGAMNMLNGIKLLNSKRGKW